MSRQLVCGKHGVSKAVGWWSVGRCGWFSYRKFSIEESSMKSHIFVHRITIILWNIVIRRWQPSLFMPRTFVVYGVVTSHTRDETSDYGSVQVVQWLECAVHPCIASSEPSRDLQVLCQHPLLARQSKGHVVRYAITDKIKTKE